MDAPEARANFATHVQILAHQRLTTAIKIVFKIVSTNSK